MAGAERIGAMHVGEAIGLRRSLESVYPTRAPAEAMP
jgi:hypothetical protein